MNKKDARHETQIRRLLRRADIHESANILAQDNIGNLQIAISVLNTSSDSDACKQIADFLQIELDRQRVLSAGYRSIAKDAIAESDAMKAAKKEDERNK